MGALSLGGVGLGVSFLRKGDRYGHRIFLREKDRWHDLLISQEGGSESRWPPSPPLQEVHIEKRGEARQVALAVGMAGDSHWSLSCELDARAGTLHFDVACRFKEEPECLGSCYSPGNASRAECTPGGALTLTLPAAGDAAGATAPTACRLRPGLHTVLGDPIRIEPDWEAQQPMHHSSSRSSANRGTAQTVRWEYWIERVEPC